MDRATSLLSDDLVDEHIDDDTFVDEESEERKSAKSKLTSTLYKIQSQSALQSMLQSDTTTEQENQNGHSRRSRGRPRGKSRSGKGAKGNALCKKCAVGTPEMPPLHYAAYHGHYTCLELLVSSKTDLQELEGQGRTPLFYACAANHVDCCAFLLLHHPEWLDQCDKQQDTPVHVCCFFGWDKCLERVLQTGANPHVRNAKGFKPSHIAQTPACLELLRSYGDDLSQGDRLDRTPLFVACARSRPECVSYLCQWHYQAGAMVLLEQEDARGDRPIHAAACNGSGECIQILVEYGVDVHASNAKCLTALDLASASNHDNAVHILEEAISHQAEAALAAPTSNSLWSECYDHASGRVFYYNQDTQECQWERPAELEEQNAQADVWINDTEESDPSAYSVPQQEEYVWVMKKKESFTAATVAKGQWIPVQDPYSQAIYYQNQATGEVQWEEPAALEKIKKQASAHASLYAADIWDELNKNREFLAKQLENERSRQHQSTLERIKAAKSKCIQQWADSRTKQVQKQWKKLLPKTSFVRKMSHRMLANASMVKQTEITSLCEETPSLEIFLTANCRATHSVSSPESGNLIADEFNIKQEKSLISSMHSSLFHYYVRLGDPTKADFLSKNQFRSVLKEARILPAAPSDRDAPLKLHIADLIFVQANRSVSDISTTKIGDSRMDLARFCHAMKMVAERIAPDDREDEDDEVAEGSPERSMIDTYLLPLVRKLSLKMAEYVHECKRIDERIQNSATARLFMETNRSQWLTIYKFYSDQEPQYKLMTFKALLVFAKDFEIIPKLCDIYTLYQIFEAVNWISGNSHTIVISYEKFLQVICILPMKFPQYDEDSISKHENTPEGCLVGFMNWLDTTEGKHRMSQAPRLSVFVREFKTTLEDDGGNSMEIAGTPNLEKATKEIPEKYQPQANMVNVSEDPGINSSLIKGATAVDALTTLDEGSIMKRHNAISSTSISEDVNDDQVTDENQDISPKKKRKNRQRKLKPLTGPNKVLPAISSGNSLPMES